MNLTVPIPQSWDVMKMVINVFHWTVKHVRFPNKCAWVQSAVYYHRVWYFSGADSHEGCPHSEWSSLLSIASLAEWAWRHARHVRSLAVLTRLQVVFVLAGHVTHVRAESVCPYYYLYCGRPRNDTHLHVKFYERRQLPKVLRWLAHVKLNLSTSRDRIIHRH
jgi:hypothetical protein